MATTGTVMPAPKYSCYDQNGSPLAGGLLEVYEAGSSVPASTFADGELSVPNPWPVPLDMAGRATVFLAPGFFKFIQRTSIATGNTLVWSQDNISSVAPFNTDLDLAGVAGEHIYEGAVAYLSVGAIGSGTIAGRWYLASATQAYASSGANVVAIAPNAIPAGATGAFRLQGRTEIPGAAFTVGSAYFVGVPGGSLVTPAPVTPNFERQIGIADSPTTIVTATGFASNPFFPGSMTVGGTLTVNGVASFGSNVSIAGQLAVAGVANFNAQGTFLQNVQSVTQPQVIHVANQSTAFKLGQEFTTGGQIATGAPPGATVLTSVNQVLSLGSNGVERMRFHASGGFSMGTATVVDPGAGNLLLNGSVTAASFNANGGFGIYGNTTSLTTNPGYMSFLNTGGTHVFGMMGNTGQPLTATPYATVVYSTSTGGISIRSDSAAAAIQFYTGGNTERMRMFGTGGVYIGVTPVDPGANCLTVAGHIVANGNLSFGTTGGNVMDGVYTPVATTIANLDAVPAPGPFMYTRIGNTVTVSGVVTCDPTTAGVTTQFRLTLPIAPTVPNLNGVITSVSDSGIMQPVGTTHTQASFNAAGTTSAQYYVVFQYRLS